MKKYYWFYSILILLIYSSCGPTAHFEKEPSVNLGVYKSYSWVDTKDSQTERTQSPTEFASLSVHNAVNEQLQKKGWTMVADSPDVLLSYDILVERDVEQHNEPVYSRPISRVYYNPYFRRWGNIYYPPRFVGYETYRVPVRNATLTLSMMDAKNDRTIWQGWTTRTVNSRRLSQDEIKSSVNSILKKFRVRS